MWLLRFPLDYAGSYSLLAFTVSAYYGFRAILITHCDLHNENVRTENENISLREAQQEGPEKGRFTKLHLKGDLRPWGKRTRIVVQYIQSVIFNSLCALAGFAALYEEVRLFSRLDLGKIEPGTAIAMAFLALLAIIGISGMLPQIIVHGKIFGK